MNAPAYAWVHAARMASMVRFNQRTIDQLPSQVRYAMFAAALEAMPDGCPSGSFEVSNAEYGVMLWAAIHAGTAAAASLELASILVNARLRRKVR